MAVPGVEIAWAGEWKKQQRRYAGPFVRCAADLAAAGFSVLGIEPIVKKKLLVRRAGRTYQLFGECAGEVPELMLSSEDVKRKRCDRVLPTLAATVLHEFMHPERKERTDDVETLIGEALDEGVAYVAETLFSREVLRPGEFMDYLKIIKGIDPHNIARSTAVLAVDAARFEQGGLEADRLYDKWFENIDNIFDCPIGPVVGVCHVSDLLDQGWPLVQILNTGSQELLQSSRLIDA